MNYLKIEHKIKQFLKNRGKNSLLILIGLKLNSLTHCGELKLFELFNKRIGLKSNTKLNNFLKI